MAKPKNPATAPKGNYSVAGTEEPKVADTDNLMEIDQAAKAQADAAAASENGTSNAETESGIKKQVSFMCPVELMVRLENQALANGVKTDAKGHTNISGVLLAAAAASLDPPYILSAKEKVSAGVELTDEDKAAARAEAARKRKEANDQANAAAAALRAKLRGTAQAQLANS